MSHDITLRKKPVWTTLRLCSLKVKDHALYSSSHASLVDTQKPLEGMLYDHFMPAMTASTERIYHTCTGAVEPSCYTMTRAASRRRSSTSSPSCYTVTRAASSRRSSTSSRHPIPIQTAQQAIIPVVAPMPVASVIPNSGRENPFPASPLQCSKFCVPPFHHRRLFHPSAFVLYCVSFPGA